MDRILKLNVKCSLSRKNTDMYLCIVMWMHLSIPRRLCSQSKIICEMQVILDFFWRRKQKLKFRLNIWKTEVGNQNQTFILDSFDKISK